MLWSLQVWSVYCPILRWLLVIFCVHNSWQTLLYTVSRHPWWIFDLPLVSMSMYILVQWCHYSVESCVYICTKVPVLSVKYRLLSPLGHFPPAGMHFVISKYTVTVQSVSVASFIMTSCTREGFRDWALLMKFIIVCVVSSVAHWYVICCRGSHLLWFWFSQFSECF